MVVIIWDNTQVLWHLIVHNIANFNNFKTYKIRFLKRRVVLDLVSLAMEVDHRVLHQIKQVEVK